MKTKTKLRKLVTKATVVEFHEHLSYLPFAEHSVDFQVGEEMFTWVCGEPFGKQGLRKGMEVDLEAFVTPEGRLRRVKITSRLGRWEGQRRGWVWNDDTRDLLALEKEAREEALKKFWNSVRVF